MKILLLNQFFWPDISATSQLLTDVAAELSLEGHDVSVICGKPSYDGHRESTSPAVQVEYLTSFGFSKNRLERLFSYLSFWGLCVLKVMRRKRPDVVVTLTTPPLLSLIGTLLKTVKGCRHVVWEMDIYPDLAVELGLLREHALSTTLLRRVSNKSRHQSDCIIALGNCMRTKLVAMGLPKDKISVAENWADTRIFQPPPQKFLDGKLRVVYPGNLGLGHDVETLVAAVKRLGDSEDVTFQFVGGGQGFEDLREICRAQARSICEFLPYEDPHRLAEVRLSNAHIGLVSQKSSCVGLLVPSKVYPLMASGIPFVFVGPPNATPNLLIQRHKCGWHICNGDVDGLVALLRELARNRSVIPEAGGRAREAFLKEHEVSIGARRVCNLITGVSPSSLLETDSDDQSERAPTSLIQGR